MSKFIKLQHTIRIVQNTVSLLAGALAILIYCSYFSIQYIPWNIHTVCYGSSFHSYVCIGIFVRMTVIRLPKVNEDIVGNIDKTAHESTSIYNIANLRRSTKTPCGNFITFTQVHQDYDCGADQSSDSHAKFHCTGLKIDICCRTWMQKSKLCVGCKTAMPL